MSYDIRIEGDENRLIVTAGDSPVVHMWPHDTLTVGAVLGFEILIRPHGVGERDNAVLHAAFRLITAVGTGTFAHALTEVIQAATARSESYQ